MTVTGARPTLRILTATTGRVNPSCASRAIDAAVTDRSGPDINVVPSSGKAPTSSSTLTRLRSSARLAICQPSDQRSKEHTEERNQECG
jgi:hypothetical protein